MLQKGGIASALILVLFLVFLGTSIYHDNFKIKETAKEKQDYEETPPTPPELIIEETITKEKLSPKPEEKEVTIYISRFDFDKTEITIEEGTKVIWENTDTRRHMITNKRIGLFRTMRKSLELGDTFEYIFNEPGTYEILEANFGINGKVTVIKKPAVALITGNVIKDIIENNIVNSIKTERPVQNANLITGNAAKEIEVNYAGFLLISINLFVLTALALVIGFYFSRNMKHF